MFIVADLVSLIFVWIKTANCVKKWRRHLDQMSTDKTKIYLNWVCLPLFAFKTRYLSINFYSKIGKILKLSDFKNVGGFGIRFAARQP